MRQSLLVLLALLVCLGCAAYSGAAVESELFDLDGVWEGKLETLEGPLLADKDWGYEVQIRIDGDTASWEYRWRGQPEWHQLWRGRGDATIQRLKTNAVVTATYAEDDANCDWVETWTFVLTQAETDKLRAHFYRVVNNWQCYGKEDPDFSMAAVGLLSRSTRSQ